MSQIAASLCRLIDEPATDVKAPLFLLDAHIDGIKAAVRGNIREADHPVAKSLLDELDQRVKDYEKSASPLPGGQAADIASTRGDVTASRWSAGCA